mgnify:CR=1 FL=1
MFAKCPYCQSDEIEGGSVVILVGSAYQECFCYDCNRSYTDVYEANRRLDDNSKLIPPPILQSVTDAWNKVEEDDGDERACALFYPESGLLQILQCHDDRQDELQGRGSDSPYSLINDVEDLADLPIKSFEVTL